MKVTVVDYGMGNIYSVTRALEHCGAEALVTSDPDEVRHAERLLVPGVGAFADGMLGIRERGLVQPILDFASRGGPLLGICLGMQMLLSRSEEFGEHEGLAIIPGKVVAIPAVGVDGTPHRIPHIGWSRLVKANPQVDWAPTVLATVKEGDAFYLVHSFAAVPDDEAHRLADCYYNGLRIAAVVRRGNLFGCQFHPEKSGPVGLAVIRRFLQIGG